MMKTMLPARMLDRLTGALALYLARPIGHPLQVPACDRQRLAATLDRGDVLLCDGNTRAAALVKRVTRSTWSHVSMYVGPLEAGPDPRCIVEADFAAGVRAIRLSELNALQVRVLRPVRLSDEHRRLLAEWVVSRIGSEYDLAQAWFLGRSLLRLPVRARSRSSPDATTASSTRFICSSLLAQAFALVGYPIQPDTPLVGRAAAIDYRNVTPGDFEHALALEMIG